MATSYNSPTLSSNVAYNNSKTLNSHSPSHNNNPRQLHERPSLPPPLPLGQKSRPPPPPPPPSTPPSPTHPFFF